MTEAEKAYAEAERRIEEARKEGAKKLDLSSDLSALDRIPDTITTLPALATLFLTDTQVTDLSPLANLPALATLDLAHTQVTDLTPLANLPALDSLDLEDTQVTDLTPIATLPALASLYLTNTQVTDLSPLATLPALASLDLTATQVTDLTPLANLPALASLDLTNTQVTDLTPLATLPALASLYLAGTKVTDLAPIASQTGIIGLDLAGTPVTRDGLRHLARLRRLVTNPGPARAPPEYQGLRLSRCAATREDPRIAEIAEIKDPSKRARALFDYLDPEWEARVQPEPDPSPDLPAPAPAPLETEIVDARLVRANHDAPLPQGPVNNRARLGWDVIRDFRDGFLASGNVANYRPLAAALAALDRALGPSYDQMNEIAVGVSGQRLVTLSQDRDFTQSLPDGTAAELATLATTVATFANRFPDWLAYLEDAAAGRPVAPVVQETLAAFDALARTLEQAPDVNRDVAEEYRDELEMARSLPASEPAARALLASTRELLRTLAENAIMGARLYAGNTADSARGAARLVRNEAVETAQVIPGELRKAVVWAPVGVVTDVLVFRGGGLMILANRFPQSLGWIEGILRYLGVL